MKNYEIRIQPFSALAGACLLALCFVATGAFAPQGTASARDVNAVEHINEPLPSDYLLIYEGTQHTVPLGKIYVATGMGRTQDCGTSTYLSLFVNNAPALGVIAWSSQSNLGNGLVELPKGVVYPAGSVISITSNLTGCPSANGILFGYLADA